MLLENTMAYSEVYAILNLVEDTYLNKIPKNVLEFFKEHRLKEYIPELNLEESLLNQNVKRETMVLLGMLYLNYWCEDEKEKQEFLDELEKNEEDRIKIEEMYNPDNLFKNKNNKKEFESKENTNVSLVEFKKQNFIRRLLNKISEFFNYNRS